MHDFDALVSMHRCCDARGFTCLHACYILSQCHFIHFPTSPPPFFTVSNNDNNILSTNSFTRILSFLFFFFLFRYEMILETATDQVS